MSDEAKVGLLVVLALAVFVTAFLYVANVQLTGSTAEYKAYFAYVGGLDAGSVVRYGGRKAGTVRSVRSWQDDMTRTEVLFEMRADVPVNQESRATIASLNALGQNYLEITPGAITAPRIEPGGTVPSVEALTFSDLTRKVSDVADGAVELMAQIDGKMTLVANDMHEVLVNLRELSGEGNRRNIAKLLENSNRLIETQSPKIDQVTTQLTETLEEVERLAGDFRQVARSAETTFEDVSRAVDETRGPLVVSLRELDATLGDARLVLADARALLLVNEGNVSEILDNARRASEDIAALSAELRQRPWTILRAKPKPDRKVPAAAVANAPRR